VSQTALEFAQANLEDLVLVSDAAALGAVGELANTAKIVTELAAAVTLAAAGTISFRADAHVVLVMCGGNISMEEIVQMRAGLDAG
jgi:threonine dehydratase